MKTNQIRAAQLPIDKLHPFEGHPYQVRDDEEMNQLVYSIITQGVLNPVVVRPTENDECEVISGHRRVHACKKAGIETVPALIYSLDRDAAAIALVDSNLHREHILPSEKAFAYKMKMEAMSRQGQRTDLTSRQVVGKLETADMIADNESGRQVQRYIRLTHLIPEILRMVDEGRIALTPAVEISYLTETEQYTLLDAMELNDCTPSHAQTIRMKKLSQQGQLVEDTIYSIMGEEKANQKERLRIPMERVRSFFPRSYTAVQIEDEIVKMCEARYRQRQRSRDAR